MTAIKAQGRKARVPYKVTVSLFPHEWDELRMESQTRAITGGELIGAILSQYVRAAREPLPDDRGDDDHQDD